MAKTGISVVIPAKDEEAIIIDTVASIMALLKRVCLDYEIILINDGSSDRTGPIMDDLRSGNGRIKVIHNKRNNGIGASLRSGFSVASKDMVLYLDMDLPVATHEIEKSISLLQENKCDIVSVYRSDWRRESLLHSFYSYIYNKIINLFFGSRIKDVNFACKLFRREIFERIAIESKTSFIKAEILIKADKGGYRIMQFPVKFSRRRNGKSKFNNPRRMLEILIETIYFRIKDPTL
jgi:glycosyltransferase involved in cell wall biosynthesis